MDRRERSGQGVTALLAAFEGLQSSIWTALPGIIQSFDATKKTARILPALKARIQAPDGSFEWVTLPELLDCPVHFAGGGGVTLTFPLKQGDECLVVFGNRCIDNWWKFGSPGGTVAQEQAELRMHDLSDGFCIAGFSSVPKVIPNISTTKAQLRNDAGTMYLEVDPTGVIAVHAPVLNFVAPTINITGAINLTGTLDASGDIHAAGTSLHEHTHTAPSGGGTTSPPL